MWKLGSIGRRTLTPISTFENLVSDTKFRLQKTTKTRSPFILVDRGRVFSL